MFKLRREARVEKYNRTSRNYELVDGHELTALGKAVAGIGSISLVAAGSFLVVSHSFMDIFGDSPSGRRSDERLGEVAKQKYNESFKSLDAATKFTVQYGSVSEVTVSNYEDKGNGILGDGGFWGSSVSTVTFNNGCLNATAFDIDGGNIEGQISGIFVRGTVQGDSPTAGAYAEISDENPDVLLIHSGNVNSGELVFSGLLDGGQLQPLNDTTVRVLDTYGCEVGVAGVQDGY